MKRIGLLSDTHGYLNPRLLDFFSEVDEIWHAGDIGNAEVAARLSGQKSFRAVYGNIDGQDIRQAFPLHNRFLCEGLDVWMTHIGGYPGNYDRNVKPEIFRNPPGLFISGHSHILKIIYDRKLGFLHINPGAAGINGFHKACTAVRFIVDKKDIREMEVWEYPRNEG